MRLYRRWRSAHKGFGARHAIVMRASSRALGSDGSKSRRDAFSASKRSDSAAKAIAPRRAR